MIDHRLEHLGCDDHRLAEAQAALHDPPLNDRQVFHRAFDPEITARDQDDVSDLDHRVDLADGALTFDFRHDLRAAPGFFQDPSQLCEVFLLACETERDEIDAQFDAESHVDQILFGQGRKIHMHAGEIDVPTRAERARSQNCGANPVVPFFQHAHLHEAVIEENYVADRDVVDQVVVVDRDRIRFRGFCAAHRDFQNIADRE